MPHRATARGHLVCGGGGGVGDRGRRGVPRSYLHITVAIAAGPAAGIVDVAPLGTAAGAAIIVMRLHFDELPRGVDPARGNPLRLLPRRAVIIIVIRLLLLTRRRIEGINPLLNLRLMLTLMGMGMLGMLMLATHRWHRRWQWRRII